MSSRNDELRWYARLMKLAHELAMDGRGQEAQDLRVAATHARNYRWLRDCSAPERDTYYLCSDQTQARFNDPSAVDKHIAADMANAEGRERARSAASPLDRRVRRKATMKWIALAERMPNPEEHDRVLIYTQGSDFAGEQVFDVKAETLNECMYKDPEDQPEVCRCATHWSERPAF